MHHTSSTIRRLLLLLAFLPLCFSTGCIRLFEKPIYDHLTPNGRTQKILFIGNSLTYYNDLPGLTEQLSAGQDRQLWEDRVTVANVSLGFHWSYSAARKHLNQGDWSYVVLQEFSTRPLDDPDAAIKDFSMWGAEVNRIGAKPIIFENWPHIMENGSADLAMAKMHRTYQKIQSDIGGEIAPIGFAWLRCRKEHPEIALFVDEKHPTEAGTYLTACVIFKTIYHKPAAGLPTVINGLKLDPHTTEVLQKIADEDGQAGPR